MKATLIAQAHQAGISAARQQRRCDYRDCVESVDIINKMIASEEYTYDCVDQAIEGFKVGFHSHRETVLC